MSRDRNEEDRILHTEREILADEREILHDLRPRLSRIKIQFRKGNTMATAGPVTLTAVGATTTASVIAYDQFGNVFEGNFPNPTFTASDTAGTIATFNATTGLVTAVGNGADTVTATITTTDANGNPVTLTDSEIVNVALAVVAPVLTSIKVAFTDPVGNSTTSAPAPPPAA
jgi:uncharacterized protein YjdB